jgi:CubicO group peptidase (beta-lactamase class C family)
MLGLMRANIEPSRRDLLQAAAAVGLAALTAGATGRDAERRELFEPLRLRSTARGSHGFSRARLVRVQVPDFQAGTDFSWNSEYWLQLGAPWGGLFATPEDFAVICQMMLSGGRVDDLQLLSPGMVKMMTTNRLSARTGENTRERSPWSEWMCTSPVRARRSTT